MKLLYVLERCGIEIFDAADRRSFIGMFEERLLLQQVLEAAIRRRENALPVLFLYDVALRFEVRIVDIEPGKSIGFGPDQRLEIIRRHDFEINGDVIRRERIVEAT